MVIRKTKLFANSGFSEKRARRTQNDEILVDSKTIGTDLLFGLWTKNLSRSGMLLSWNSPIKVPFIENTLLELRVDAFEKYLDQPLDCLGKVVRRVDNPESTTSDFGVKIVQIDIEDQKRWDQALTDLEQFNKSLITKEDFFKVAEVPKKKAG